MDITSSTEKTAYANILLTSVFTESQKKLVLVIYHYWNVNNYVIDHQFLLSNITSTWQKCQHV